MARTGGATGREKRVASLRIWRIISALETKVWRSTAAGAMVGKRITEPGFSDCPAPGRSFRVTMAVIGGIALIQLVALAIGVIRRGPGVPAALPLEASVSSAAFSQTAQTAPQAASVPPAPQPAVEPTPAPVATTPAPVVTDAVVNDPVAPAPEVAAIGNRAGNQAPVAPVGDLAPQALAADAPSDLFAALAAASRSQPLSENILERLLVTGAELRESGNMQGALQAFRQVETAMPDHPRVLAEIGATLGKMGLKEKADGYWERVDTLGSIGAGAFHPLAAFVLRGEVLPGTKSAATPAGPATAATAPAKTLKIGKIDVGEEAPTSEGQKVSLRVLIEAAPGAKPAGEDLSLLVYFYDRIPDGTVRPSTADTSYLYPTEPYDWQVDGTEVIVVNYLQPVFTEEQKRELGERSFYGYAIELYYRDELQDKVAMPEDIAALRFDGDSGGEDSRGGAPGPTFLGPENALFPDSVVP